VGWTKVALSALVKALIRSAVQADPARALCTTSFRLVSRDENEMTLAEAIGITQSSGRCDNISIGRVGIIPAKFSGDHGLSFGDSISTVVYLVCEIKQRYQSLGSSKPDACPLSSD
jgi:hypothetical protein